MRIERIRGLMAERDWSQAELARQVGATQGSIQQILAGNTLRSRLLPDIARAFGVSVHYLLGDTDDPRSASEAFMQGQSVDPVMDERVVVIRQVDIAYGMDAGTLTEDFPTEKGVYLDVSFVRSVSRAHPSQLFMAKGAGDSMMPTLLDSDTILVDRSRKVIDQQDRVWAMRFGDASMVKRVRRLPGDVISVMSDNPAVSSFEAAIEEIEIVGRVIWVARQL